jgi:tubulin polyglutamylase TTLL1
MNSKKLKWRTDFDKEVVIENFIRRGWTKADK